jgi:hypothetical protein
MAAHCQPKFNVDGHGVPAGVGMGVKEAHVVGELNGGRDPAVYRQPRDLVTAGESVFAARLPVTVRAMLPLVTFRPRAMNCGRVLTDIYVCCLERFVVGSLVTLR